MIWKLFYKLFSSIDPEFSHNLFLKFVQFGLFPKIKTQSRSLKVMNLRFLNPIGLAAGFDKNAVLLEKIENLGFAFTEVGTITVLPQKGNPKPRVFRLSNDEGIINRYGFNNDGVEIIKKRIKSFVNLKKKNKVKVGINIGPNKNTKNRIQDYKILINKLSKYADYFSINISSPNTPNLRDLQSEILFNKLIVELKNEIKKQSCKPPILIKISPDIDKTDLVDIINIIVKQDLDGLIISNTTIKRNVKSKYKNESGGLSGKPLFEKSTKLLLEARKIVDSLKANISIIGCGGINDGKTAYIKILCGADLIQIYTSIAYRGPFIVQKILNDLEKFRKRDSFKDWIDVRGKAKTIMEAYEIVENGFNKKL